MSHEPSGTTRVASAPTTAPRWKASCTSSAPASAGSPVDRRKLGSKHDLITDAHGTPLLGTIRRPVERTFAWLKTSAADASASNGISCLRELILN